MAREKGTGSLQLEKSGRWTMRVGIKGKRYSRSTRTTDREEVLRQAVAAIPSLDDLKGSKSGSKPPNSILQPPRSAQTVEQRLRQLEKLKRKSLISEEEYASTRSRILAEI